MSAFPYAYTGSTTTAAKPGVRSGRRSLRSFLIGLLTLVLGAAFGCLIASRASALDVSVGDVVARNLGSYGFTATNSELSFDSGATDQLYQMFGYIGNGTGMMRVDGTSFAVTSGIAQTGAGQASSTITLNAAGATSLGLTGGALDITYDWTLVDDSSAADLDYILWDITLVNTTATDLALTFYTYLDLDLDGASDFNDDLATASNAFIHVSDSDNLSLPPFIWYPSGGLSGGGADHFEVRQYPQVRNGLDGMATAQDLSDSFASFGPGDFTGAFQYDITVPALGSVLLGNAVPEPGTFWLLVGGLGAALLVPSALGTRD